jgi:hypothetical protein
MTPPKTNETDAPQMHYCIDTIGSYDGLFDNENVLVSAGLAYRNPGSDLFNIHVPENPAHLIVDSGGYQVATRWNGEQACKRGLQGQYPYTPAELHEWGDEIGADVVAGMDVACDPTLEIFDFSKGHIRVRDYKDRMVKAREYQARQRPVFERNDYGHDFMPIIQGNTPEEYEEFIQWMATERLDQYNKIAVGTLKGSNHDEILDIVLTVRDYFPNKWVHLCGASLNVYKDPRFDGLFDSSDTSVWNWGAKSKSHKKELFANYRGKVEEQFTETNQERLPKPNTTANTPTLSSQLDKEAGHTLQQRN